MLRNRTRMSVIAVAVIAIGIAVVAVVAARRVPFGRDSTSQTIAPVDAVGSVSSSGVSGGNDPRLHDPSLSLEERLAKAGSLFKDNNQDIPAIDGKTLEDLEKGLVAMGDKATFGMVRDMALAMRAGLRDEKSHEWTKQAIGKYLSDVDKDGKLSDVLDLVGKTCFKDREALGKLVEPVIAGLCSGYLGEKDAEKALCVFVSPESTKELCGRLVSANEGPLAAGGEVAARLCRRDETLREWMKTVEGKISQNSGECRARWCVAMGHAEMMKVTPPDPLRKVKWLVEAEKCGKATLKGLNSKAGGETPG